MSYLLDSLHEDLNRADKLTNMKKNKMQNNLSDLIEEKEEDDDQKMLEKEPSDESLELIAYAAWKDHLFNNRSIIVDLFQG